ncbi:MAG: MFS transporter [Xanthobacteraceae bacterium]|nr:MFS transporter [Xanthobacteraceae bacterium]
MTASRLPVTDETSIRYPGWRIVAVCFVMATFSWGLGFYGQSVYLPELQRLHGWPTSWISAATTLYYLVGAALVVFVGDAIGKVGARATLIAGVICIAAATALLGHIDKLWQLYAVYALLACGWAGTSLGAITNTLGLWFDRKRGMAISLALNGASFGGIVGVPLLTAAIAHWRFTGAMLAAACTVVLLLVPLILFAAGTPPARPRAAAGANGSPSGARIRAMAFRDVAFLTLAIAFALVLFAQVGVIVHLIAFLDPVVGREHAAIAVALLTAMAMIGRLLFSVVIDRLNQRLVSALSFVSQACALAILINFGNTYAVYFACALFGFSVGNLITLPALIVQRDFPAESFGVLISLNTAVTQVTYAFGPGVIGVLRDLTGGYTVPFIMCIALELSAAALIMVRGRAANPRYPAAA